MAPFIGAGLAVLSCRYARGEGCCEPAEAN
jgi:hypothetical protein